MAKKYTEEDLKKALELRFDCDIGDDISIKEYFLQLLLTLWEEGEGFNGKRPFGNSGWESDLYIPLIQNGFIKGTVDAQGWLQEVTSPSKAHAFVSDLILQAFKKDS